MTRAEGVASGTTRLRDAGIPPTDARAEAALLLRYVAGIAREELFLRPDLPLASETCIRYDATITRRAAREPLAYITGTRDFYGIPFVVTPAVLIPRPETEGVVDAVLATVYPPSFGCPLTPAGTLWVGRPLSARGDTAKGLTVTIDAPPPATARLREVSPLADNGRPTQRVPAGVRGQLTAGGQLNGEQTVLDLCTGSGAIAVAVAVCAPNARVTATDISDAALAVARINADRHGVAGRVTFLVGDLFAPIAPGARFAVVAANPPYIAPDVIETLEPEVRFEPRIALGVHADALFFYRRIAAEAGAFLLPGGRVVVEVGQGQADAVCDLFRRAGFAGVETLADLSGILRVVVASGYNGATQSNT